MQISSFRPNCIRILSDSVSYEMTRSFKDSTFIANSITVVVIHYRLVIKTCIRSIHQQLGRDQISWLGSRPSKSRAQLARNWRCMRSALFSRYRFWMRSLRSNWLFSIWHQRFVSCWYKVMSCARSGLQRMWKWVRPRHSLNTGS